MSWIADFDILIIEDNAGDARLLKEYLKASNPIELSHVTSLGGALERLQTRTFDSILLDLSLPDSHGLETFRQVHSVAPATAIVVLTGLDDDTFALQAMREGAQDYLSKNRLDEQVLVRSLHYAVERKRSELALRESERFARSTIDALAKHIAVLDEHGNIIEVNNAWQEFARNNDADLTKSGVGTNYLAICDAATGEDADFGRQFAAGIRSVMRGQLDHFSLEYPCHAPFEKRWFVARVSRFSGDGPMRLVVSHDNITERKQAEIDLAYSEELHRTVLSSISDAVFITTESGEFTYVCPNLSFIFGYTHEEALQLGNIRELLGELPYNSDTLASVGEVRNIEHPITDKTGEAHTLLVTVKSVNIDGGSILYTCRDVTERYEATVALHESEERYRALFDHSLNPVYIHDFQGNFIDGNQAALELLGYTGDELMTLNIVDILSPDDVNRARQTLQEMSERGYQQAASEFQVRRKDNTRIDVETMSSVIYHQGEPWAIQGIARDITEQKRAHAEERARRILAEALQETTTAVLSGRLDLDAVLERILEYTVSLIPCNAATLLLVESGVASVFSCRGYSEEEIEKLKNFRLVVSETPNLQEMVQTRRPVIVSDTQAFSGWRTDKLPPLTAIRSNLGAPIFVGDQLIGFINLDSDTSHHFTQMQTDQLAQLTNQASIAIHNVQLYEQINKQTKRLEVLHTIDRAILRADEPQAIAQVVLSKFQALLGYHSASVTTFDIDQQQYTILATTASNADSHKAGTRHAFERLDAIEALKQDQIYTIEDLELLPDRSLFEDALITAGIRSYTRIPLISSDKLLGSINIRSENAGALPDADLAIAQETAAQLAIAIENARLLEVEKRRNSELTAIHQASLQLTSTLDLETVLHTILDYAVLMVEADNAHIFLYDGEQLEFGSALWDGATQSEPLAEPRPDGLTYTVARSAERLFIPNMQAHPLYRDVEWDGAVAGLPLSVAGEVNGVMLLRFARIHQFDENEIRLMELLADQAAIAIHNAQSYEQIQSHADQLERRVIERTQQLQRAKDRVEAILSTSNDALVLADMNGKIYQINPGFNAAFGYAPEEINDRSVTSIIKPDSVDAFNQAVQKVLRDRLSVRLEVVAVRKDQTTFPADALISSVTEVEGVGILCSLRDITLQKQVEADLREALAKEKELNDLKTQFTSIVSHEFRTPLAVILTTADILHKYQDRLDQERKLTKLKTIVHQVQRLTQLMDNVLLVTRSETVGFEFKPVVLDLVSLCQRIIDEVQIRHNRDASIDFYYDDACRESLVDEFLFSHILQNLASNAVKYSTDDSRIQIHLKCAGGQLELQVIDRGIGIPLDHQKKLFESFQRASNVGDIQGTGIGMTIVKRAVDTYGGLISFESVEGQGTTFIVTLPVDPTGK